MAITEKEFQQAPIGTWWINEKRPEEGFLIKINEFSSLSYYGNGENVDPCEEVNWNAYLYLHKIPNNDIDPPKQLDNIRRKFNIPIPNLNKSICLICKRS